MWDKYGICQGWNGERVNWICGGWGVGGFDREGGGFDGTGVFRKFAVHLPDVLIFRCILATIMTTSGCCSL